MAQTVIHLELRTDDTHAIKSRGMATYRAIDKLLNLELASISRLLKLCFSVFPSSHDDGSEIAA